MCIIGPTRLYLHYQRMPEGYFFGIHLACRKVDCENAKRYVSSMSHELFHVDAEGNKTQLGRCASGHIRVDVERDCDNLLAKLADIAREPATYFVNDYGRDDEEAQVLLECFVGDVDLEQFARDVARMRASRA